jgi:pimeloyl-ACP methyl ester carboxylesterase
MRFSIIATLLLITCLSVTAQPKTALPSVDSNPSLYVRPANQTGPFKRRVIVFVHGMFGNSDDTWRYSSQIYWPNLLLSDTTFGDSDIYVAAYPTPFVGGRMNLEDIVSNLENRLTADHIFSKHREVVFVCHSLGGLVVEKLLLKNRDYDRQVPFIYFFGTPQTGADIARLGKLLGDPLFKDLSASQDNEVLQGIEDEWRAAHLNTHTYCAYERKAILGELVVDRLSATRNCTESAVAIDENHIGMVKPSSAKHDSYIALVNAARSNPIRGTSPRTQIPATEPAPQPSPSPTPSKSNEPRLGVGPDAYKDLSAAQVGQWAMDEADKIEEMAAHAYDRLGYNRGDASRFFFKNDYNDCCAQDVKELRSEILRRLGPPGKDSEEIMRWNELSPAQPLPAQFGDPATPIAVAQYAPYLRRLGLKLKRTEVPRAAPLALLFTVQQTPLEAGYSKHLVTINTNKELASGFIAVQYDATPSRIVCDLQGSQLALSSKDRDTISNPLVIELLKQIDRSYVLQFKQPVASGSIIHVEISGPQTLQINGVTYFEE